MIAREVGDAIARAARLQDGQSFVVSSEEVKQLGFERPAPRAPAPGVLAGAALDQRQQRARAANSRASR